MVSIPKGIAAKAHQVHDKGGQHHPAPGFRSAPLV